MHLAERRGTLSSLCGRFGLVDSPDANDNSDVWNNIVLLQRLTTISTAQRTARYRCVLVAARDGEPLYSRKGRLMVHLEARAARVDLVRSVVLFACNGPDHAEIDLETKLGSVIAACLAALLPKLLT